MGSGAFGLVWPITKYNVTILNLNVFSFVNPKILCELITCQETQTLYFYTGVKRFPLNDFEKPFRRCYYLGSVYKRRFTRIFKIFATYGENFRLIFNEFLFIFPMNYQ